MEKNNEILAEIWNARKEIEKENHNNLVEIFEHYNRLQEKDPKKYFHGEPLKIQRKKAA